MLAAVEGTKAARQGKGPIVELFVENTSTPEISEAEKVCIESLSDSLIEIGFTNTGLLSLANFPALASVTSLSLADNRIRDGFDALHGLPQLQHLDLGGNRVADVAALRPLAALAHLKRLDVVGCPVAAEGGKGKGPGYRGLLFKMIGSLEVVDGEDCDGNAVASDDEDSDGDEETGEETGEGEEGGEDEDEYESEGIDDRELGAGEDDDDDDEEEEENHDDDDEQADQVSKPPVNLDSEGTAEPGGEAGETASRLSEGVPPARAPTPAAAAAAAAASATVPQFKQKLSKKERKQAKAKAKQQRLAAEETERMRKGKEKQLAKKAAAGGAKR